jgi:hypothetical protein
MGRRCAVHYSTYKNGTATAAHGSAPAPRTPKVSPSPCPTEERGCARRCLTGVQGGGEKGGRGLRVSDWKSIAGW